MGAGSHKLVIKRLEIKTPELAMLYQSKMFINSRSIRLDLRDHVRKIKTTFNGSDQASDPLAARAKESEKAGVGYIIMRARQLEAKRKEDTNWQPTKKKLPMATMRVI